MVLAPDVRILILGLGDPANGNEGIGARLARSLSAAFRGVEVRPASDFVSFAEVFYSYDVLVVLNSISLCGNVGRVSLGSPQSLADGWGIHASHVEAFDQALSYARLMGHRLPRIEVVNICIGLEDWPEQGLSPSLASMYRGITGRVRALIKEIIREVEQSATVPPG